MKILILNWRDIKNPKAGGSELYFHEMAKRWVTIGHEVVWITSEWKNCRKRENIDGIEIIRSGSEMSFIVKSYFSYKKLKIKPEIILDVENGLPFFTPIYAKEKKILHIHHIHDQVWFNEASGNNLKNKLIAYVGYFLEKYLMPVIYKNTKVITISKSSEKELRTS